MLLFPVDSYVTVVKEETSFYAVYMRLGSPGSSSQAERGPLGSLVTVTVPACIAAEIADRAPGGLALNDLSKCLHRHYFPPHHHPYASESSFNITKKYKTHFS